MSLVTGHLRYIPEHNDTWWMKKNPVRNSGPNDVLMQTAVMRGAGKAKGGCSMFDVRSPSQPPMGVMPLIATKRY